MCVVTVHCAINYDRYSTCNNRLRDLNNYVQNITGLLLESEEKVYNLTLENVRLQAHLRAKQQEIERARQITCPTLAPTTTTVTTTTTASFPTTNRANQRRCSATTRQLLSERATLNVTKAKLFDCRESLDTYHTTVTEKEQEIARLEAAAVTAQHEKENCTKDAAGESGLLVRCRKELRNLTKQWQDSIDELLSSQEDSKKVAEDLRQCTEDVDEANNEASECRRNTTKLAAQFLSEQRRLTKLLENTNTHWRQQLNLTDT
jgi:chromosome segregation ATPase